MSDREIRLVPMEIAGRYKTGVRLKVAAPTALAAWEAGLTEDEAEGIRVFTEQTWNSVPETERIIERGYAKLWNIFERER